MSFAKKFNICATVSLQEGIDKTISWYLKNQNIILKKFNVFNKTL